ncbi:MAG: hypothetical protein K2X27_10370 [Candidatus Obscuribacterales bacterium]|nr:hypothetical protein [Candidatus Obscuribacterales bacterium]
MKSLLILAICSFLLLGSSTAAFAKHRGWGNGNGYYGNNGWRQFRCGNNGWRGHRDFDDCRWNRGRGNWNSYNPGWGWGRGYGNNFNYWY